MMFPEALAIAAPIPTPISLLLGFGPALLLVLLTILDLAALALLRAALDAKRRPLASASPPARPGGLARVARLRRPKEPPLAA